MSPDPVGPMRNDLLQRIVAATRATVETRRQTRPLAQVEREAAGCAPDAAGFRAALTRQGGFNVIAECKRRSPVSGLLRPDYAAADLARSYEAAGAAAISVLTEPAFFDGALADLTAVRSAVRLPLLRKDFVVDEYQLAEARAAGADAVLLIVAVLMDRTASFVRRAADAGLAAVVEVHGAAEIDVALDAGADLIGVNSRNLRTMDVRPETCVDLAARLPARVTAVAESGIRTGADLARLRAAGYSAFLVGERLVRSPDPGGALRDLMACT